MSTVLSRTLAPLLRRSWSAALLGLAVAVALVAVGWRDFVSARREFATLVEAQAGSIRDTVAAAARANRTAALTAEKALADRLLDNARLLAELDRRGALTPAVLGDIAERNRLFRITVIAADSTREQFVPPAGAGPGRGQGGPGWFAGPGAGTGPGATQMIEEIIRGGRQETVTDLHAGRRAGMARLAAGVRRANGGAITVSVDATEVLDLQRQTSLDRLLDDIVGHTADVAYLVFDHGDVRREAGDVPADASESGPVHDDSRSSQRRVTIGDRPVLELTGPIDIGDGDRAHLHLGMRLDGLQRAERRTAIRLATTLSAATTLGVVALGLVWLYREYGALSLEHDRAQAALRRKDRLAAMGELASTVAHEIRNPLNAIAMSAQRLARECFDQPAAATSGDRDDARALVQVVQAEARRIDRKVQQFLDFARPPRLALRATLLAPWLRQIAGAAEALAASRGVRLETLHLPDVEVVVDPEQLRQAVDNLVRNAIDATPKDGRVVLGAEVADRELTIAVADTGHGIAAEHLPRIFDLYFTTKHDGTGVGLAVTHQIVVAHGGRIDVESVVGRGTTMRLTIPAGATDPLDG